MSNYGGNRGPVDWTTPHRWASLVEAVHLTFFCQNARVLLKDTSIGTWGVLPRRFDYKPTLIRDIKLFTKLWSVSTRKTLSNRLRHASTSSTSFWTSCIFLDALILKLHKSLHHFRSTTTLNLDNAYKVLPKILLGPLLKCSQRFWLLATLI